MDLSKVPAKKMPTWFETREEYRLGKRVIPGKEFVRCLEGLAAQGIVQKREVKGKVQYGLLDQQWSHVYVALGKERHSS